MHRVVWACGPGDISLASTLRRDHHRPRSKDKDMPACSRPLAVSEAGTLWSRHPSPTRRTGPRVCNRDARGLLTCNGGPWPLTGAFCRAALALVSRTLSLWRSGNPAGIWVSRRILGGRLGSRSRTALRPSRHCQLVPPARSTPAGRFRRWRAAEECRTAFVSLPRAARSPWSCSARCFALPRRRQWPQPRVPQAPSGSRGRAAAVP